jgi:hypothetical protein
MSEFDPAHNWETFKVHSARTTRIEFAEIGRSESFGQSDCQVYGYPFLAMKICLKEGAESHILIIGELSL